MSSFYSVNDVSLHSFLHLRRMYLLQHNYAIRVKGHSDKLSLSAKLKII